MRALRGAATLLLCAATPLAPRLALAAPPPIVIAHRGVVQGEPENSLAGFRSALARGAWIEADVRSARDGTLVVIHDARLGRTTNGRGWVSRRTLPQLRRLSLDGALARRARSARLPTLAEVLALEAPGLGVVIDVKRPDAGVAERLARALRERSRGLAIAIGFRDVAFAALLRSQLPETQQIGFIPRPSGIEAFAAAGVDSIRLQAEWLAKDPGLAARVRASGAELHVALDASDPRALRAALQHAPAALLCDHPAEALAALRNR